MKITFTPAAVEKIKAKLDGSHKKLKFLYDSKDCGCALNGIPALILIDEPTADDAKGIADPLEFYYEPRHAIFYDDHMKVDFNQAKFSFILKSDSQIYTTNLQFIVN